MKAKFLVLVLFYSLIFSNKGKSFTISTTTTWTSNQTFTGDLIIASGASLTLSGPFIQTIKQNIIIQSNASLIVDGVSLNMNWSAGPQDGMGKYPDGSIVVLASHTTDATPGGRLYLKNNAEITGDFSATGSSPTRDLSFPGWYGIFVEGIPTNVQSLKFGQAILKNSIISNSTFGVSNFNYQNEPNLNYSQGFINAVKSTGGIINATGMTFEDNVVDVNMVNYGAGAPFYGPETSIFVNCTFNGSGVGIKAWGNLYGTNNNFPVNYLSQVYLQKVHGVRLLGCTFQSAYAELYAVNASDAGFTIDQYCSRYSIFTSACTGTSYASSIPGSYFDGAVVVNNTGNFNPVVIQNTTFTNTIFPIVLSGCYAPVIQNNTIPVQYQNFDLYNIGIALIGCTDYTLQNNSLSAAGTNYYSVPFPLTGIGIENSGANYNLVNNNICSGMDVGIQVLGNNWNGDIFHPNLATGLTLYCNNMASNTVTTANDLAVELEPGTGSGAQSGIAPVQGNSNAPAGNTFSSTSTENIYNPTGNNFIYWFGPGTNENPTTAIGAALMPSTQERTCALGLGIKPYTAWNNKNITLAPYIHGGGTGWTSSTSLMETAAQNNDSMINELLYADTAEVHLDTLETVLDSLTYSYDYQVQLAGLYMQENRYTDAMQLLNTLPTVDSLDSMTTVNINNLMAAYAIVNDLYINGYNWDSLTTGQQDTVYNIDTTDQSYAQIVTHQLLHQYTGVFYPPHYVAIPAGYKYATTVNNVQKQTIAMYPNPVAEQLYINTGNESGLTLTLCDMSGRQMIEQGLQAGLNSIDLQQLNTGVYLVKIYKDNRLVKVDKVVKN